MAEEVEICELLTNRKRGSTDGQVDQYVCPDTDPAGVGMLWRMRSNSTKTKD